MLYQYLFGNFIVLGVSQKLPLKKRHFHNRNFSSITLLVIEKSLNIQISLINTR